MKQYMCGERMMRRYIGALDLLFKFSVNQKSLYRYISFDLKFP